MQADAIRGKIEFCKPDPLTSESHCPIRLHYH